MATLANEFLMKTLLAYLIVIALSVRMWRYMKQSTAQLNQKRTREMHRQIGSVLLVQALTPLVGSVFPIVFLTVAVVTHQNSVELTRWMTMMFNWTPLINALSTLLIVRPYRRAVFGLGRSSVENVMVNAATTTQPTATSRGTLPQITTN